PPPLPGPVTWPGWVVTAGLAVGAGVTGAMALTRNSELATLREPTSGATREKLTNAAQTTQGFAGVTDGLIGAAVVAGGVTLAISLSRPAAAANTKTGALQDVRVGVSPTGAQIMGRF